MNWKNLKNIIRKELKESKLLNEIESCDPRFNHPTSGVNSGCSGANQTCQRAQYGWGYECAPINVVDFSSGGCTSDDDCDPNQYCVEGACILGGVKNTYKTRGGGNNGDCCEECHNSEGMDVVACDCCSGWVDDERMNENINENINCTKNSDCPDPDPNFHGGTPWGCIKGNCIPLYTDKTKGGGNSKGAGKTSGNSKGAGKTSRNSNQKTCYRIDAGGCLKCNSSECNKKTTPCKYSTLQACKKDKDNNGSLNENVPECCGETGSNAWFSICCRKWKLNKKNKGGDNQKNTPCTPCRNGIGCKEKGCTGLNKNVREATSVTAGNTKFNLRTGVNKNPTKLGIKIQFEPLEGGLESETKAKLEVALQEKLNTALSQYDIQISKDTDVPRKEVIGFFIPLSQVKNLIIKSLTGKKVADPTVPAPPPEGGDMEPPLDEIEGTTDGAKKVPKGYCWCGCKAVYKGQTIDCSCCKGKDGKTSNTDFSTKDTLDDTDVEEMIAEQILKEALKVGELNEMSKTVTKEDFYGFINAGQNILRTLDDNNIQKGKKYLEYLVKHNII